jgi:hypothetical protein
MEDYDWVMFPHAMDFFKEWSSLKKPVLEHFFTSLLNNLSIEDLVTLANLLSIKIMKPRRCLYATPSRQTLVPQESKNKVLKIPVNRRMIRPALKPWNVYNSWKKRCVDKWRKQNHNVCIKLWLNRHLTKNIPMSRKQSLKISYQSNKWLAKA